MKKESACAACKYLRRRCKPECPMAPYFPGNDRNRFMIVHRLYGYTNVLKRLQSLQTPEEKDSMMQTIHFEAVMRQHDPVRGASGVLSDLLEMISLEEKKLNIINHYVRDLAAAEGGTARGIPPYNPPFSFDGNSWVGRNTDGTGTYVAQPGVFCRGESSSQAVQNPNPAAGIHVAPSGVFLSGENGSWGDQNPNPAAIHVGPLGFSLSGEGGSWGGQNPSPSGTRAAPPRFFSSGESSSQGDQNPNTVGIHVGRPSGIFSTGENGSRDGQNPNSADIHVARPPGIFLSGESGSNPSAGIHVAPLGISLNRRTSDSWGGQNPIPAGAHMAPPGSVSWGGQNPNPVGAHAAPPGIFSSGAGGSLGDQNPNPADVHVAPSGIFSRGVSSSRGGVLTTGVTVPAGNVAPLVEFYDGASGSRNSGEPNIDTELGLSLPGVRVGGSITRTAAEQGVVIGGGNGSQGVGQNPAEARAQPVDFDGGVGLQDGLQDPAAGIHVAQTQPDGT